MNARDRGWAILPFSDSFSFACMFPVLLIRLNIFDFGIFGLIIVISNIGIQSSRKESKVIPYMQHNWKGFYWRNCQFEVVVIEWMFYSCNPLCSWGTSDNDWELIPNGGKLLLHISGCPDLIPLLPIAILFLKGREQTDQRFLSPLCRPSYFHPLPPITSYVLLLLPLYWPMQMSAGPVLRTRLLWNFVWPLLYNYFTPWGVWVRAAESKLHLRRLNLWTPVF